MRWANAQPATGAAADASWSGTSRSSVRAMLVLLRDFPHCDEVGHLMKKVVEEDGTSRMHCVRTIHAEQNAICQAAKHGISLKGGTLYCKMEPCRVCAMLIISVGITKVIAKKKYHAAQDTRDMFQQARVELVVVEDEVEQYSNHLYTLYGQ